MTRPYGRRSDDMRASILSIGTELLRGEVRDSNAAWLAAAMTRLGFDLQELVCVEDHPERIEKALRRLGESPGIVLVTGGLGPTTDDVTVQAAAAALGVPVVRDPAALERLHRKLQVLGRAPTTTAEKQTEVPDGADVLGNPAGVAPSFRATLGEGDFYFMPGISSEMEHIFEELITRRLVPLADPRSYQIVLRTYGLSESAVGEKLVGLEASLPGLTLAYRVVSPEVDVKLLARANDVASARALAERAAGECRARLGAAIFGDGDDTFAGAVGRSLRARGYTLAVAESCTGGLIGSLLTAVPGSSDYLLLDAVTYSNASKERVLQVPSEVLRGYGAVSAECVRAMADGARRLTGADVTIAVSGIAGPGGGSAERPVGLVYFALCGPRGAEVVERRFLGDRAAVQRQSAYAALAMVRGACAGPVETLQSAVCG